ncbi:MAG: response regulator [Rhodospirillaceae bacterium]
MAKILVVDDRPANRQFLMTLLGYAGHALREAHDGQAALDAAHADCPDLVITDVLMPGVDGFELARRLRAGVATKHIPIIFYTSTYRTPEALALAEASGANTVLRKPSEPEVILQTVNDLLGLQAEPLIPLALPHARLQRPLMGEPEEMRIDSWARLNARLTALIETTFEVDPQQGAQHVVEMFFDTARKMFAADFAAVMVDPGEGKAPAVLYTRGLKPESLRAAWGDGYLAEILQGEAALCTADPAVLTRLGHDGVSGDIMVAEIVSKQQRYGWLFIGGSATGGYLPEDKRALQTVAGALAVFYEAAEVHEQLQRHATKLQIESAARERAEAELRKRYREQAAVAEFGVAALSSEQFTVQVERSAEIVCRALDVETCVVVAVNVTRDTIEVLSSAGWTGPAPTQKFSEIPKTSLLHVALTKGGVRFADIRGPLPFVPSARLVEEGVQSGMIERSAYGDNARILIYTYSRTPRAFTPAEADFLRTIGNAIAILQDRKATLERLTLRERALEAISQGIWINDETAMSPAIIYSNPALQRMTGFTEAEFLQKSSRSLLADDSDEILIAQLALARTKRRSIRFETKIRRKDGATFIGQVAGSPIVAADGSLSHSVVVIDDVTEARRRDEQIHESQRMEAVGQLTGGIAHDFNNLLTVIKANAEDLLMDSKADRAKARQVEMLLQAANRGADLVQQLMAFARKQELAPTAIDINEMLSGFSRLLTRTLPENIRLSVKRAPNFLSVLADPSRLENALLNLCLNARDAMVNGGGLTIETQVATLDHAYAAENAGINPGQYVMIAVTDEGHGMPKDVVERAFQPFFTTKEIGKGTGLGLSMVYGFVKQSGGHAKIYSEVGYGTTIKLYLPFAELVGKHVESAADAIAPEVNATGYTILLVEDDDLVRESVTYKMERMGLYVTPAGSAAEALEILENKLSFDLVFTDIIMPGSMSGADLALEVIGRWPGTRVIMTSGYTEASAMGKVRIPDGIRLLSKPYANADLIRTIQEVMAAPPPT